MKRYRITVGRAVCHLLEMWEHGSMCLLIRNASREIAVEAVRSSAAKEMPMPLLRRYVVHNSLVRQLISRPSYLEIPIDGIRDIWHRLSLCRLRRLRRLRASARYFPPPPLGGFAGPDPSDRLSSEMRSSHSSNLIRSERYFQNYHLVYPAAGGTDHR